MTETRDSAGRPLRILEMGGDLFKKAAPGQTDNFWTDRKKRGGPLFGPSAFWRTLKRLRAGHYDLVIVEALQFSPFNPRSFLTAIREWHVQSPVALFSMLAARFLHNFHSVPVAALDFRDTFGVQPHLLALLDRCTWYFKRELPADRWQVFFKTRHWDLPGVRWRRKKSSQRWVAKLQPISLGYVSVQTNDAEVKKTSDVFFAGDSWPNSTVRTDGIKELLALRAEGFVIDVPEGRVDHAEFQRRLAGAWLGWSPAGYGWDCFRHYESALLGTVPLINYPTLYRYQPLIDGQHCVHYRVEPGGLAEAIRAALNDKDRLSRIGRNAKAHVLLHHTFLARAEHIAMMVLGRRLDGSPAGAKQDAAHS